MKDQYDKESIDTRIEKKKGTRWEQFDMWELHMIAYGLSQIYDNEKDSVNKLLKELNPILFPKQQDGVT